MVKHKNHSNKIYILIIPLVLVVAITVFAVCSTMYNGVNAATKISSAPTSNVTKPLFSLANISGWWQGATDHTSMAAFQIKGHGCFISAERDPGQIVTEQNKKFGFNDMKAKGYTVTLLKSSPMKLTIDTQPSTYTLNQYNVVPPPDAMPIKQGQAYGYVQLAGGYIKVMAQCDEANQLPVAIPALAAIKYDAS